METSKAIRLIKDYVIHYIIMDNLWSIGLATDYWMIDKTGLCEIIFNIDTDRKDVDDVVRSFRNHADKLNESITNYERKIPDEKLTSTAIDIYSDWKAYSQRQPIKA